jgi:CHAT domain-containing protein
MAIRVDGRPLYETATTIFHADLRAAPRDDAPLAIRRALVLADPPGVLPAARHEADRVAAQLAAAGVDVVRADGLDRRALRAAWARSIELFHYSGHGVQAGLDGLEGGIPLADGARLSTLDVLTTTAVPRRAVLAACDLGRRGSTRSAPGLGFAHALLLVGADEVVAATRPVDDAATTRWVERLYDHLGAGADLAEAVRAATAELADTQDATAFRLWSAAR